MDIKWLTTMKPSFQTEWLALPPKESHQVLEKIALLTQDPSPDGKVKKQLKHIDKRLHRIRAGDYRIFYTFEMQYISLLALRRRSEDTYNEDFTITSLGGLDAQIEIDYNAIPPTIEGIPALPKLEKRWLPEPITEELLTNLHVPQEYHSRLLSIKIEDDLLNCSGVSSTFLEKILEYMFPRDLRQVMEQPDYVLEEVDDLQRFKEGKLLSFLLKLSPEQERAANWAINATGPTQVKGNPGTGKSIVALYRVRSLIQKLLEMGLPAPCILYTTYTNALVKSSDQLLKQLLGNDIQYVAVKTADLIVWDILERAGKKFKIADDATLTGAMKRAAQQLQLENSTQYKELERLSHDYLLEEVRQFIMARKIATEQDYLAADRRGRKLRLGPNQRKMIWRIYEIFLQQLKEIRKETWQQVRLRAEDIFTESQNIQGYDAVVVDEAQDLDPSVLRLLVGLCKSINRFFITADANQSIYKFAFTWNDVHESLKFQGRRTTVLNTNYRSTRQISEAAQFYLANGALETEVINSLHMYSGPKPIARDVHSTDEEIQLLASFLPRAAHECRLLLGSCAVLCPTWEAGITIAEDLSKLGIRAQFMVRQDVDLEYSGVKVLTLHSSKGLEFPIVVLAGLSNSRYARIPENDLEEGREEVLERDRRTLFVGMTRAMRTLLVLVPAGCQSPLLTGFDSAYWDLGG